MFSPRSRSQQLEQPLVGGPRPWGLPGGRKGSCLSLRHALTGGRSVVTVWSLNGMSEVRQCAASTLSEGLVDHSRQVLAARD